MRPWDILVFGVVSLLVGAKMASRFEFESQQPNTRQHDRVEDSLLCSLCGHCWSKVRWCQNQCCRTLRAVACDLDAREASEATMAKELAVLRRSDQKQKDEIQELNKVLKESREDGRLLKDIVLGYRSNINSLVGPELRATIRELMQPKLTARDKFVISNSSKSTSESPAKSVNDDKPQPRGLKAILADASKHNPGESTLHQLRSATAKKLKRVDVFHKRNNNNPKQSNKSHSPNTPTCSNVASHHDILDDDNASQMSASPATSQLMRYADDLLGDDDPDDVGVDDEPATKAAKGDDNDGNGQQQENEDEK